MNNYNISKNYVNNILQKIFIEDITDIYLKQAINLSLINGKRLRPIITYEIAKAVNLNNNTNYNIDKIILVPELIHTTSLIIDDLPCMDNDIIRRNNPTIHYKYGERSAQILTMYLFSKVYNLLYENLETLKNEDLDKIGLREELLILSLVDNLGIYGAPLGQYLDICKDNNIFNTNTKEIITHLVEKKTATFFEISFTLGFISSGGDLNQIPKIKMAAKYFGIAFQISDDFIDSHSDNLKDFCPNMINYIGYNQSIQSFNFHINKSKDILKELKLYSPVIDEIFKLIVNRIKIVK